MYLGQIELGCIDEDGSIIELKVLDNPNHLKSNTSIAFEIQTEVYVPIYDLQGNVACLIDPERRMVEESYHYCAFGEEEITNHLGQTIQKSDIGNPWRYRGNRIDEETGYTYIGCRYYDPEMKRWTIPDPAQDLDGPNVYVYCQNNPLTYTDYSGLESESRESPIDTKYFYGEYEPHCFCERHRDCKRGGDIRDLASLVPSTLSLININEILPTHSEAYEIGFSNLPNVSISFINGIHNFKKDSVESARLISRYTNGVKVQGIYNATNSPPVDIIECLLGHMRVHTPPVQLLKKNWEHFIATHGPDVKLFQVCHSGGSIHVLNALNSSPKSVQDKIIVLAIAPGAIVPKKLCFRSYNYASKRDFIPKLDILGNLRYGDELILLAPHPDAKKHDHNFDSPTFKGHIKYHLTDYLKQYGDQR